MDDAASWVYLLLIAGAGFAVVLGVRELTRGIRDGVEEYHARQAAPQATRSNDRHPYERSEATPPPPSPKPLAWHEVLGVSPNSNLDEIRAAYRKAITMYHPDRVAGLAPELQALAELRAKELNAAYATACAFRS
ncbi:MAG TPA: J domain-containing protein [Rariglobus sp.]